MLSPQGGLAPLFGVPRLDAALVCSFCLYGFVG